jgi:hypothetical protein
MTEGRRLIEREEGKGRGEEDSSRPPVSRWTRPRVSPHPHNVLSPHRSQDARGKDAIWGGQGGGSWGGLSTRWPHIAAHIISSYSPPIHLRRRGCRPRRPTQHGPAWWRRRCVVAARGRAQRRAGRRGASCDVPAGRELLGFNAVRAPALTASPRPRPRLPPSQAFKTLTKNSWKKCVPSWAAAGAGSFPLHSPPSALRVVRALAPRGMRARASSLDARGRSPPPAFVRLPASSSPLPLPQALAHL